jgi:phthiodiolone/phenolphthiodiolone dimycocerosates ketoreductase
MTLRLGMGILPTSPIAYAQSLAEQADADGLDSIMVPDHLMAWFPSATWPDIGNIAEALPSPHVFMDPMLAIASWARTTESVRFATAVTDPIRRPPGQLAVSALSLSHLTGGRFILGISCGEAENTVPYGMPFDLPVSRLEEALQIIRLIWTQDRVDFDGRFWQLRGARCNLGPYDGRFPEIWVGAHGPRMLALTGEHADGWLPFQVMPAERYAQRLSTVRTAAERAGRDPDAIVAGYNTTVFMADDHDRAHAMIASAAVRQMMLAQDDGFYEDIGLPHPLGSDRGATDFMPEWLTEQQLREAFAVAPDPMLAHDFLIHGTPQEVAAQLKAYEDAGMQYFAPLDTSPFTDITQMPGTSERMRQLKTLLDAAPQA